MGYIGAGPTRFNTADELTVTGDAEITGAITTDGMTTTGNVSFGDNDKAIFGAGSDLQIYHDGVHSTIKDAGSGSLFLQASNNIYIQNAGGTANYFKGTDGGASELFYNGSTKLATTATGVDVTGGVVASGGLSINSYGDPSNNYITLRPSFAPSASGGVGFAAKDHDGANNDGLGIYGHDGVSFTTGGTERLRIKSDGTLQLTSNAAGANTLEASITAYNVPQSQVNSRIDFLTDTYQNSGQIKLRTNFGATTRDGLIVDELAHVTMPYQPSFSCYKNGIMTEASGDNRVENWTENHDQGGHLNNSTGRFTAPVSGKYFFAFSAMHSGLITGDLQFRIFRNGAAYQASNDTADGGNWDQCTVIAVVAMAANDYVEPYVYSNATTSREVVYTGIYSGWHGYLIG